MGSYLSISVPAELIKQFQQTVGKGNVSSEIAAFMESRVRVSRIAVPDLDPELLSIELAQKKEALLEVSEEVRSLEAQAKAIDDSVTEYRKAELLAEKERVEQATHCMNCKGIIPEDQLVVTKLGNLCRSCFRSLPADKLKEYI